MPSCVSLLLINPYKLGLYLKGMGVTATAENSLWGGCMSVLCVCVKLSKINNPFLPPLNTWFYVTSRFPNELVVT